MKLRNRLCIGLLSFSIGMTSATSQVLAGQRVRVSQKVAEGLVIKKVRPEYPPETRRDRIQGTVLLRVLINKAGDIAHIELISGHPALARLPLRPSSNGNSSLTFSRANPSRWKARSR